MGESPALAPWVHLETRPSLYGAHFTLHPVGVKVAPLGNIQSCRSSLRILRAGVLVRV